MFLSTFIFTVKPLKVDSKHQSTPDNSPKRKRTRQTPSNASPATPDAPPHKRRRWALFKGLFWTRV